MQHLESKVMDAHSLSHMHTWMCLLYVYTHAQTHTLQSNMRYLRSSRKEWHIFLNPEGQHVFNYWHSGEVLHLILSDLTGVSDGVGVGWSGQGRHQRLMIFRDTEATEAGAWASRRDVIHMQYRRSLCTTPPSHPELPGGCGWGEGGGLMKWAGRPN